MARRPWLRSVFAALLVSAGTAAAQLGLGYGLGIVAWTPDAGAAPPGLLPDIAAAGAWSASLAWTTWVAATSVVAGTIAGDRRGGKVEAGHFVRMAWRTAIALAATLGALLTVPLAAIPARHAEIVDNYAPHLLAAIYAVAGAVLGLIVSLVAVAARAAAANVVATAAWLWLLATIAAADGLAAGHGPGYAHLAVWEFTRDGPFVRSYYVPGVLLSLGAALLLGGLAAFPAAGRGAGRVGIAISGAAGPLLVAVAYALADPRPGQVPDIQVSAFRISPYVVLAGLAGSVLVAVVGVPRRKRRPAATPAVAEAGTPAVAEAGTRTAPQRPAASRPPAPRPPASPTAVTATASVPASSRATPDDGP